MFHTKLVGIFLNAHNTKSHLSTSKNIILFETQITLPTATYKCNSWSKHVSFIFLNVRFVSPCIIVQFN